MLLRCLQPDADNSLYKAMCNDSFSNEIARGKSGLDQEKEKGKSSIKTFLKLVRVD